jgi:hypothetical protein
MRQHFLSGEPSYSLYVGYRAGTWYRYLLVGVGNKQNGATIRFLTPPDPRCDSQFWMLRLAAALEICGEWRGQRPRPQTTQSYQQATYLARYARTN